MKFVDEAVIDVKAGDGGDGCVSFRREKFVPRGGPDGGSGGKGGDIIFFAKPGMSTLMDFRYTRRFEAPRGQHGQGAGCNGASGEDLLVPVPVGTVILDDETGDVLADLVTLEQQYVVAHGGRGGRGNATFTSSVRQAPDFAHPGKPGASLRIRLELKLMADVGLIGLPNAGKSTFLTVVSRARPKIADYPFTTLSPCLGVVALDEDRSFVVADLPGLIEGAHDGKGLGDRFLKHCERTRVYLHLVSLSPDETDEPLARYRLIESELSSYDPGFKKKAKLVLLTKSELMTDDELKPILAVFKKAKIKALPISSVAGRGVPEALQETWNLLEKSNSR